jgi:hypothetical protein
MMKHLFIVLLVILSCGVCDNSQSAEKERIQNKKIIPSEIIKQINKEGAYKVAKQLSADQSKWDKILRNVAGGEKAWLEVAVKLRPGTDAGASEMLNLAMGEALDNSPKLVLEIIKKGNIFTATFVCSAPDVDDSRYSTYEKAIIAVNHRIAILEKIDDTNLKNIRSLCIGELKKSIPHLKKYYGRK